MKKIFMIPVMLLGLFGYASANETLLSQLKGKDAQQAGVIVNQWRTTNQGVTSSYMADALEVRFKDGKQVRIAYTDKFPISIAPYLTRTHECGYHSISGCRGEFANKRFAVTITDSKGKVAYNNPLLQSMDNGFFDIWLPINGDYLVEIKYEGKSVSEKLSTRAGSRTCITTMQLS